MKLLKFLRPNCMGVQNYFMGSMKFNARSYEVTSTESASFYFAKLKLNKKLVTPIATNYSLPEVVLNKCFFLIWTNVKAISYTGS